MEALLGCDIHAHTHAQDSLYNKFVNKNSTAGIYIYIYIYIICVYTHIILFYLFRAGVWV